MVWSDLGVQYLWSLEITQHGRKADKFVPKYQRKSTMLSVCLDALQDIACTHEHHTLV